MFDTRPDPHFFFIGRPGHEVLTGDSVTLRIGGEFVPVNNVIRTTTGSFKAILYGFDPGVTSQEIEFDEAHIFGCHKHA